MTAIAETLPPLAQKKRKMKRRISLSIAFLLAAAVSPAFAEAPVCRDLRAQLSDLPDVIGNGPDVRRYAAAISRQTRELRKVESDLRRNRCQDSVMTLDDGGDAGFCGELGESRARMLDTIRYLKEQRDAIQAEGSEDGRNRRRLLAALSANGCEEPGLDAPGDPDLETVTAAPTATEPRKPVETFIKPDPALGGREDANPSGRSVLPRQQLISDVNTICVRSCDGGFFPLHSNVTSVDFAREAETCAAMCPGIKTELFYQAPGNADQSRMISATTGAPYTALPNAYAYKNRKPGEKSECACDIAGYYERMRQKTASDAPAAKGSITDIKTEPAPAPPTPAPKPEAASSSPPQPAAAAPAPERPYDPSKAKVRQVGPQFLPAEQGAIDLKSPASPGPQPRQP